MALTLGSSFLCLCKIYLAISLSHSCQPQYEERH